MKRAVSDDRSSVLLTTLFPLALLVALASPVAANTFSLTTTDALEFGSFVAGSGGTVTIAAASGLRTSTGTVLLVNSSSREARLSVSCTVDGGSDSCTTSSTYSVDPVADTTLTSGGNTMPIGSFSAYSIQTGSSSGQLASGSDTLKIGATLTVGNNQPPGNYSGSFSVTVIYQ